MFSIEVSLGKGKNFMAKKAPSLTPQIILPKKASEDFKSHWVSGMPNELYHSKKEFISNTTLQDALDSPAHYYYYNCRGMPRKQTRSMELGNIIHSALEDPELYLSNMVVEPKTTRDKKGYIQKAMFKKEVSADAILVSAEEREAVMRVIDSVYRHRQLPALMKAAKKEVTGFFKDPYTGFASRFRVDQIIPSDRIIMDVKTTYNGSKESFRKSVINFRYYFQAAFYLMGAQAIEGVPYEQFFWVVAETNPPYSVELYPCDPAWLGCGEIDIKRALLRIDKALKTDFWPSYQEDSSPLSPPHWFMQKEEYSVEPSMEHLA